MSYSTESQHIVFDYTSLYESGCINHRQPHLLIGTQIDVDTYSTGVVYAPLSKTAMTRTC